MVSWGKRVGAENIRGGPIPFFLAVVKNWLCKMLRRNQDAMRIEAEIPPFGSAAVCEAIDLMLSATNTECSAIYWEPSEFDWILPALHLEILALR